MLFGLSRSTADPCIYFRCREEELTHIAIWVDDGLVCSSSAEVISDVLKHLNTYFDIRAIPADCFVGMEIIRDRARRQLYVNQAKFIASILNRFNMDSANPKATPADPSSRLTISMSPKTESETFAMRKIPYREAVGCLMYLTIVSRPDIAFAVGQVSRYCENPGPAHWEAVKRILACISGTGTRKHGLFSAGAANHSMDSVTQTTEVISIIVAQRLATFSMEVRLPGVAGVKPAQPYQQLKLNTSQPARHLEKRSGSGIYFKTPTWPIKIQ